MRSGLFLYRLAALFLFLREASCSYCGINGVPFSLEILPSGTPVLGCAQPSCVRIGEAEDDSIFVPDADGQFDGYFRDEERPTHIQANKFNANCSGSFDSSHCPKKSQWVGGIEYSPELTQPLALQCCTFEGLRFSQDVGVTTISAGEAVTGGEVIRDERQISFDIIANVRKVIDPEDDSRVVYEVTIRRMNCLPDPPEIQIPYDDGIEKDIERVLKQDKNREATSSEDVDQKQIFEEYSKKEKSSQSLGGLSFGAPTFEAFDSREVSVRPRFVEERPPSIYSTTVPTIFEEAEEPLRLPPTIPLPPTQVQPHRSRSHGSRHRVTPIPSPYTPRIPLTPSDPTPAPSLLAPAPLIRPPGLFAPIPPFPAPAPLTPPPALFTFPTLPPFQFFHHLQPVTPTYPLFTPPPFIPFSPLPGFGSLSSPPGQFQGGSIAASRRASSHHSQLRNVPGLEESPTIVRPQNLAPANQPSFTSSLNQAPQQSQQPPFGFSGSFTPFPLFGVGKKR